MIDDTEFNDELEEIARRAAQLPPLEPSRDLWAGIEARIQAPVVALPTANARPAAGLPWRRLAIAASLLVAATAGVTYTLARRGGSAAIAAGDSAGVVAPLPGPGVQPASYQVTEQTFDREIGTMRRIVDERRGELDPVTVAVLEKNLKLIDAAIAESKAALAKDPASAFLMDRLTHAFDTKLQLLRGVASLPAHS